MSQYNPFGSSSSTHYDTLGVSPTASRDEIRRAFLELSKRYHPDVGGATANAERFKAISAAANVLTHQRKRQEYDCELNDAGGLGYDRRSNAGPSSNRQQAWHRGNIRPAPAPTNPWGIFFHNLLRPRTFVLGTVGIFVFSYVNNKVVGSKDLDQGSLASASLAKSQERVKAWKNPATGQWEQPAPWDPTYQRLRPKLQMVPREQVQRRNIGK